MTLPLSQAQIVDLLSELYDVPPGKRGTLLARLQHLSRIGFPTGVNTGGRGKRAKYGALQIAELLLAFELMQLGMPSERAADLVLGTHHLGYPMIHGIKDFEEPIVALIRPDILSRSIGSGSALTDRVSFSYRSVAFNLYEKLNDEAIRFAFINITRLFIDTALSLEKAGYVSSDDFHSALIEAGMSHLPISSETEEELLEAIWPEENPA